MREHEYEPNIGWPGRLTLLVIVLLALTGSLGWSLL